MGIARLFKSAALAVVIAGAGAPAALAATFNGIFSLSGSAFSEPGLVMATSAQSGSVSFQLDTVGQSVTFDLFDIWATERRANGNNTRTSSLVAAFDFAGIGASGSATGSTAGHGGLIQYASLAWGAPILLNFGHGGVLSLTLSDATFSYGVLGFGRGQPNGATIQATATLVATPVPLPASGFALMAALAAAGLVARRRRAA